MIFHNKLLGFIILKYIVRSRICYAEIQKAKFLSSFNNLTNQNVKENVKIYIV